MRRLRDLKYGVSGSFPPVYTPDLARFSLTPSPDSVILESLRGVVPAVLSTPGTRSRMALEDIRSKGTRADGQIGDWAQFSQ